jgi:hypothetical protein
MPFFIVKNSAPNTLDSIVGWLLETLYNMHHVQVDYKPSSCTTFVLFTSMVRVSTQAQIKLIPTMSCSVEWKGFLLQPHTLTSNQYQSSHALQPQGNKYHTPPLHWGSGTSKQLHGSQHPSDPHMTDKGKSTIFTCQ